MLSEHIKIINLVPHENELYKFRNTVPVTVDNPQDTPKNIVTVKAQHITRVEPRCTTRRQADYVKVHVYLWYKQAGRSKQPRSSSGVAPSEASGQFWNESLGCHGDGPQQRDSF